MVSEIRRDEFFNSLQTDPKVALTLLKILFGIARSGRQDLATPKSGSSAPAGFRTTVGRNPSQRTAHGYAGRVNPLELLPLYR